MNSSFLLYVLHNLTFDTVSGIGTAIIMIAKEPI